MLYKNIFLLLLFMVLSCPLWSQFELNLSATQPSDCFKDDGRISIGGLPGNFKKPKKSIRWSNGESGTDEITGLSYGNYCVTVVDDRDCSFSGCEKILSSTLRAIIKADRPRVVLNACNGEVTPVILTADHIGGVGEVSYSWQTQTITSIGTTFVRLRVTDALGCSDTEFVHIAGTRTVCPKDPNDITGPPGYGEEQWVAADATLPYRIRFENDPEFATAFARVIRIEHVFDDNINPYSFRLSDYGFANLNFNVPPNSTFYAKRLDLRDSLGVYVDVTAGIELEENRAFWIFEAVDPETGILPSDPFLGILPVNDTISRKGEGYVNFTVVPKEDSETRDSIVALADIVFDFNEVISTPEYVNIIDAGKPSSILTGAVNVGTQIDLEWSGQDDPMGSGVQDYTIYISKDDGPFEILRTNLDSTRYTYSGLPGHTYTFYTRARDNVGNLEDLKGVGEASVTIENVPSLNIVSPDISLLCAGDSLQIDWSSYQVGNVRIRISSADLQFSDIVADDLPEGSSPVYWPIPADFSCEDCLLKIEDTQTANFIDSSVFFTIFPIPMVDAGTDQTICQGSKIQLLANGAFYYEWQPDPTLSRLDADNPVASPNENKSYKVTGTTLEGCQATDEVVVTIAELPEVQISLPQDTLCSNASPMILSANPPGGTFNGFGVKQDTFDPGLTGVGEFAINYIYEDANGCRNNDVKIVHVLPFATLSISGLAGNYLLTDASVNLVGMPTGGRFSGAGISANTFDPQAAGVGMHTIIYTYTNANGCTSKTEKTVTVFGDQDVFFSGLPETICQNAVPIVLLGNPVGGTFTGAGMSGVTFDPAIAGVGVHEITYNSNGATFAQTIVVLESLSLTISGLEDSMCLSDQIVYVNGNPVGGQLSGDGLTGNTLDLIEAGLGLHTYTYNLIADNGCVSKLSKDIRILALPDVSFTGLGNFYRDTAAAVALTGVPTGGEFSGPGMIDSLFYPNIVENGKHLITYTYTDPNGCGTSYSQEVDVFTGSTVFIAGLAEIYCEDSDVVVLTGNPANGLFSGPGVINNTFNPSQAGVGTHIIEYTVENNDGETETVSEVTNVLAKPELIINNLNDAYCSAEETILLSAEPAGGSWSGPGVNGNEWFLTALGLGTFTIQYMYTNEAGCAAIEERLITIYQAPEVRIENLSETYCVSDEGVTLTLLPTGGVLRGSGIIEDRFYPNVAGAGTHEITYDYTDPDGCRQMYTREVVVISDAAISFSGLPTEYCENGAPIELLGTPAGGVFSGPGIQGTTFTPLEAGTFQIIYEIINGTCSGQYAQEITIHPAPSVSITALPNTPVCEGDTILLTASGGTQYEWSTSENDSSIQVTSGATFGLTITDANNCSATDSIQLDFYVPVRAEIAVVGDTLLSTIASSYQWYLDGLLLAGATDAFIVPLLSGDYTVETVDSNGCITISEPVNFITTTTTELGLADLKIQPNPADEDLNVEFFLSQLIRRLDLELLDVKGVQLIKVSYQNQNGLFKKRLDVRKIPNGIYSLRITDGTYWHVEKVVVMH